MKIFCWWGSAIAMVCVIGVTVLIGTGAAPIVPFLMNITGAVLLTFICAWTAGTYWRPLRDE